MQLPFIADWALFQSISAERPHLEQGEKAMTINRRAFVVAIAGGLTTATRQARSAQVVNYPARPVTIITPAPAGSGPDVITRLAADHLGSIWRQQVLVLNRPGAGGLIAMQAATAAKPDGHTLVMPLSSTFFVLPETHPKMPLDVERDIVPIGLVCEQPMAIAAHPGLGVETLAGLIALARKRPGEIHYGANIGGLPHLTGELLQHRADIKLTHVPYPNQANATRDAVGGTMQFAIESLAGLGGPIASGQLRPLAIAASRRVPNFTDLPTIAEAAPSIGVLESRGWFALTAPTGTPDIIVAKISNDLRAVLARPDLQQRFASLGTYPRPMSPDEVAAFIHSEKNLWRPTVRKVFGLSN
jgi:tripartite-type tricarboxylate transporter receptor subunit TctC